MRLLRRRPIAFDVVERRLQLAAAVAHHVGELLLRGGKEPLRLAIGVRREYVYACHGVGLLELPGTLETGPVLSECGKQSVGGEVRGEGGGQAERGGELRAVEARAEDP